MLMKPNKHSWKAAIDFPSAPHVARRVLAAFLLTFFGARVMVLLITMRVIPDLYFYVGQTHVHHLNYGIFLLSLTGAATLMLRLSRTQRNLAALCYGIGLALTFDEFGMWLHLGGGYWQRSSYDAVVVVTAALGLIVISPAISMYHSIHWLLSVVIALVVALMIWIALWGGRLTAEHVGPTLKRMEQSGPQ